MQTANPSISSAGTVDGYGLFTLDIHDVILSIIHTWDTTMSLFMSSSMIIVATLDILYEHKKTGKWSDVLNV